MTGITGAGKSEFISLCTGQDVKIGKDMISCQYLPPTVTQCTVSISADSSVKGTSEVEDWTFMYNKFLRVHLIDTPGFDDTKKKDVEVLRDIAGWMGEKYKQSILLSGLIYLHPISDNRLRGSALRNLYMFKKLCGPECLRGIVLATTMWDLVPFEDGVRREKQLRATNDFWGEMEKGGSIVKRHLRTKESALSILEVILKSQYHLVLTIQDEMVNQKKGLEDTGAGIKVNEDLIEADRKHRKELEILRQEMKEADASSKLEIARLMQEQQQEIDANTEQRKKLEANLADLEKQRASDMEDLQDQLKKQSDALEARETEIKNFRASLKAKEEAHDINQVEQRKLQEKLERMEREQADQAKALKDAVEAAQRKSPSKYSCSQ